jgi:hypothetical protein
MFIIIGVFVQKYWDDSFIPEVTGSSLGQAMDCVPCDARIVKAKLVL